MKFKLLSERDMKAMDALKEFHGGAAKINETIAFKAKLENRKAILAEKGGDWLKLVEEAEELVKKFPKLTKLIMHLELQEARFLVFKVQK
jgi:hypothetical protein